MSKAYLTLMRWHAPAGSHLLFLPGAWSLSMGALATQASLTEYAGLMTLFGVGSLVMRGAGCTINDLWDQKMDRMDRPLASGALKTRQAIGFLGGQLAIGLGILTQLNTYSIVLGACSLPLVVIYPLMKRITFWPQAVLGLTFNWGALLGYSAIAGSCDWSVVLPLYAAGVNWTLFYDTIYALQAGVKSTALRFGSNIRKWLGGFLIGTVSCLGLAGWMNHQSWIYYTSLVGASLHLVWQWRQVNPAKVENAGRLFKSNVWTGWIILGGLSLDLFYSRHLASKSSVSDTHTHRKSLENKSQD